MTTNQIFKWVFFYSHELLLPFFCHFGLAWLSFWPERHIYTDIEWERYICVCVVCVCLVSRLFMNVEYNIWFGRFFSNERSMTGFCVCIRIIVCYACKLCWCLMILNSPNKRLKVCKCMKWISLHIPKSKKCRF